MQKWEYKYIYLTGVGGDEKEIERKMNDLGAEGWELIGWNNVAGFIFKRPKS